MSVRWLICIGVLAGCAPKFGASMPPALASKIQYEGPNSTRVDLLRIAEGGSRIYVQADFPDGSKGLFLVDTGAAVSVISQDVADRLGLRMEGATEVTGLAGTARVGRATIPTLALGDAVLDDVQVVVGVPGVPETALFMPQAGILGNNIWQHFIMEIDYPADLLVLHRPGTKRAPRSATPVYFDGGHVLTPIHVVAGESQADDLIEETVTLKLDTGASELLMSADAGRPFEATYTEGVEPVYGIGASEFMPPSVFLNKTRRIPVLSYTLGGRTIERPLQAQWMNFDDNVPASGPRLMRGLIGHRMLQDHRVWLDYQSGLLALTRSKHRKRQLNGHRVLLEQDIATFGEDAPDRQLYRARMLFALDDNKNAMQQLSEHVAHQPDDAEARVLLAKARRIEGDLTGAWRAIEGLAPAQLVEEGEIIAATNGLIHEDRVIEATALAAAAVLDAPDDADARIALADAKLASGDFEAANNALLEGARIRQNPDANLLRRARVALAQGDRHGALAKVRHLVKLYPTSGKFLWFYATLVVSDAELSTFRLDIDAVTARQHPSLLPLDFLTAAQHATGNDSKANEYLAEGLVRDCEPLDGAAKLNCTAWFYALAGTRLDEALALVDEALQTSGDRPDYLDTKATVHLARGEFDEAHTAAVTAARLSPNDVYMLWQAERIAQLQEQAAVSQAP